MSMKWKSTLLKSSLIVKASNSTSTLSNPKKLSTNSKHNNIIIKILSKALTLMTVSKTYAEKHTLFIPQTAHIRLLNPKILHINSPIPNTKFHNLLKGYALNKLNKKAPPNYQDCCESIVKLTALRTQVHLRSVHWYKRAANQLKSSKMNLFLCIDFWVRDEKHSRFERCS